MKTGVEQNPFLQESDTEMDIQPNSKNNQWQLFLKLYLKKWRAVLAILVITVGGTLFFTLRQAPVYSASAIYVVSPSKENLNAASFVSGLSVLGGQSTITNTYASIATSDTIKQNAVKALGISQVQARQLMVDSRVQNGTNLIEITVQGTDPLLVQAFTNSIGQSTLEYVDTLYSVYEMKLLDGAKPPENPISPNVKLNLAVAVFLGVILSVGMVLISGIKFM